MVGREEGLLLLPTIRILYSHNRPQNIPDLRLRHVYYWSILMLTLAGPGSGRGRGGGTDSYYLGSHIVHLAVRVCGYSPLPTTEVGLTKTGREWLCCMGGITRPPFANHQFGQFGQGHTSTATLCARDFARLRRPNRRSNSHQVYPITIVPTFQSIQSNT